MSTIAIGVPQAAFPLPTTSGHYAVAEASIFETFQTFEY